MIAPSGARPSVTKRQIAIKSLRAKATIVMRRISTLKRANTVPEPCRMAALWLVAKPKPGELDDRFCPSSGDLRELPAFGREARDHLWLR